MILSRIKKIFSAKKYNSEKAVTLIEAVVVVVLVSVVASIALVNLRGAVVRGEAQQKYLNLIALHSAQTAYKATHGHYLDFEGNCAEIKDQIKQNLYLDFTNNNGFCCNPDSSNESVYDCSISGRRTRTVWDYELTLTDGPIRKSPNSNPMCAQGRGAPANYCPPGTGL